MALRLNPSIRDPLPYHIMMLEELRQRIDEFDVIHFHIDLLQAPLFRETADRTLRTLHGRLDLPDLIPFYRMFRELPLASVSHHQRSYLPDLNWVGTVHHGLPRDLLGFQPQASGGYLVFLGRIAPEKGPNRAIEIASRTGKLLKIAAKVDRVDQSYWEEIIRPMVDAHSNVEFIGEIAECDKEALLGGAAALLFPIAWPEPFGLAMIESMACGTPIIAFRSGSVTEVVEDGTSGVVVNTIEQAVQAVRRIASLDRARVRAEFERRFTADRMARDYVKIYRQLTSARTLTEQDRTLSERGIALNVMLAAGSAPMAASRGHEPQPENETASFSDSAAADDRDEIHCLNTPHVTDNSIVSEGDLQRFSVKRV
jgi:glycosyltransferase involved in cell wall biosynthesis